MTDEARVIEGKEKIKLYRMTVLRGALKLEVAGMRRRGRSVYSIIKEEFGLRGSKQSVLNQFNDLIEKERECQGIR